MPAKGDVSEFTETISPNPSEINSVTDKEESLSEIGAGLDKVMLGDDAPETPEKPEKEDKAKPKDDFNEPETEKKVDPKTKAPIKPVAKPPIKPVERKDEAQKTKPDIQPTDPKVKPVEEKKPAEEKKGEFKSKIEALKPPTDPEARKNFEKLETTAKTIEKALHDVNQKVETHYEPELRKAQATIKDLQTKLDEPRVPKETQERLQKLTELEQVYRMETSPQFQAKFDKKIDSNVEKIYGILKGYGLEDATIDQIKAGGGLLNYVYKDGTHVLDSPFWQEKILPVLKFNNTTKLNDRAVVQKLIDESYGLRQDKQAELDKGAEAAKDWNKQELDGYVTQIKAEQEDIQNRSEALRAETPWMQKVELQGNEPPEEKAQIEAHNKAVEGYENTYKIALNPKTPQQRVEAAAAVVIAFRQVEEMRRMTDEINELNAKLTELENAKNVAEESLAGIRGASKTTHKASIAQSNRDKTSTVTDKTKMSDHDAVNSGLDEAMGS